MAVPWVNDKCKIDIETLSFSAALLYPLCYDLMNFTSGLMMSRVSYPALMLLG